MHENSKYSTPKKLVQVFLQHFFCGYEKGTNKKYSNLKQQVRAVF